MPGKQRNISKGRFSISSGCFFPMSMCGWIGRDTWILTSSVGSAYFMHERKTSPAYLIGTKGTAKPVYLPAWRSGKNGVNKIAWLPRRLELWSLHLHLWDQIRWWVQKRGKHDSLRHGAKQDPNLSRINIRSWPRQYVLHKRRIERTSKRIGAGQRAGESNHFDSPLSLVR